MGDESSSRGSQNANGALSCIFCMECGIPGYLLAHAHTLSPLRSKDPCATFCAAYAIPRRCKQVHCESVFALTLLVLSPLVLVFRRAHVYRYSASSATARDNALTVVLSADFDIKRAPFWLLILMDTGLLIIRDADLWCGSNFVRPLSKAISASVLRYDFVEFMQARLGETCGSTVVGCMQIMSGHEEGVARLFKGRAANQQKMAMKEQTTHAVDREFLDNAILSEVLCSLVLFVVCGTCSMLTAY